MHSYSTDSDERKNVPLYLAGLSILFAWLLHGAVSAVPWWIDAPSVIGFYGLTYIAWNNWLWSWPIFKRLGVVSVPNLNGSWSGDLQSSFDNHNSKQPIAVIIRQQWSSISVMLSTSTSKSHSVAATLLTRAPGGAVITYEYLNEPAARAQETMNIHRGTARLFLDGSSLTGEYYTGRGRMNFGSLTLTKAERPKRS